MNNQQHESVAHRQSLLFGQIIRRRRLALGLNQRQVALAVGAGERFIVDLEKGKATSQLGKALAVAKALGIDIGSMLLREQEAPEPDGAASRSSAAGSYDLPKIHVPGRRS